MKTNLSPNVAAALCYLPFWIGAIASVVFLLVEEDKTVRFHAVQALLFMVSVFVLTFVTGITIILPVIIGVGGLIAEIVLVIKSYQGQKIVLPVVGEWSEKILAKISAKK